MSVSRVAALAVLLTLLAPSASAGARAPDVDRHVPFATVVDDGGRRKVLRLDLWSPRPAGRRAPAVVWIHGGGFARGHRSAMEPFAARFAQLGYVAATIDYRLSPGYGLETPETAPEVRAAREDAAAAVRWLHRRAPRLGVDPSRIYVAGSSAGAMTALNVALQPRSPVRAAVSLMGYAPVHAVPVGAPPLLLLHGTADRTIPFTLAERTCALAAAADVSCELVPFEGLGHRLTWRRTDELLARTAEWLRAR
jgi:acetyl esterase/lipase